MSASTATPDSKQSSLRSEVVRIGAVSFLNTLPLVEGLGKLGDVKLTLTAPSLLIDLLLHREIDTGLVSLIDYLRSPEPLAMIPAGMIGSDGPTLTVRLFSSKPIEQLTRIHVDADSHTSVALLRVILAERFDLHPEIVEFDVEAHRSLAADDVDQWPEAQLLIGDKVVTDSPPAIRYPEQLDLGEAWKQLTGLPFVYAIWMCRMEDASSGLVRTAEAILDRQRRHNTMRLDWIIAHRAEVRGWPADLARRYLVDLLRYEVTDDARRSIDRFFDLCHEYGIIPQRRKSVWVR